MSTSAILVEDRRPRDPAGLQGGYERARPTRHQLRGALCSGRRYGRTAVPLELAAAETVVHAAVTTPLRRRPHETDQNHTRGFESKFEGCAEGADA